MKNFLLHFFIYEDIGFIWVLLSAVLFALALAFLCEWLHFRLSIAHVLVWIRRKPQMFWCTTVSITSCIMFLAALTASLALAFVLSAALVILLAYVDYLLQIYRNKPFVPRDIAMAVNLSQLAHMLSPGTVVLALLVLAVVLMCGVWLFFLSPGACWPITTRIISGILFGIILFGFILLGKNRNPLRKLLKLRHADFSAYVPNQFASYDEIGFLLAFFERIFAPVIPIPKDYSKEKIIKIVEKYTPEPAHNEYKSYNTKRPNIIFVMSEAFSDPCMFPQLKWSEDPIPFIRKLMTETYSGSVLCPGYGGGTAHCECEVLTGLSTALCGDLSLYENRIAKRNNFPSFAEKLKKEGYRTIALHPYNDTMYARPKAYKALGFEQFITQSKMNNRKKLDNCPYISDAAAYDEAMELLCKNNEPAFIHLVTMQNHGGYPDKRFINTLKVKGIGKRKSAGLETYAQGLRYTDEATQAFLKNLKALDRETVVFFWGDHLPFIYPHDIVARQHLKKYTTPAFCWKSSGNSYKDCGINSPMFFSQILSDYLGLSYSAFDYLLDALNKKLKGIHMDFLLNGDNRLCDAATDAEAIGLLDEFKLIQYDLLAGEGYAQQSGFFDVNLSA